MKWHEMTTRDQTLLERQEREKDTEKRIVILFCLITYAQIKKIWFKFGI